MDPTPENGQMIPQGDESKLLVIFYDHAVQNAFRSTQEGRPVFDKQVWIKIMAPGNKNQIVERKSRDEDRERFPAAWHRYTNRITEAASGTPIEQWPRVSVSQVAEMKAMNILTVEHLAGLSDSVCQKMMGLDRLRTEAQAYMKAAADSAYAQRLAAELAKRDDEIARLNAKLDEFAALLDKLSDKAPPGRREKAAA